MAVNIMDVKVGDEIFLEGQAQIVTGKPVLTNTPWRDGKAVMLNVTPSDYAGEAGENTLELGSRHKGSQLTIASTVQVEVIREGLTLRGPSDYTDTSEGLMAHENGQHRSELTRVALLRTAKAEEGDEITREFRIRVRRALAAELSVAEIVKITGLSRERIYQIRDSRR